MCCDSPGRTVRDRDGRRARGIAAPLLALVLLTSVTLATGCGKKGDPLPPLRSTPLQTKDLSVRQEGGLIMLELSYPQVTAGGQPLDGIDTMELWVLQRPMATPEETPPAVDVREFQNGAEQVVTLSGSELEGSIVGDSIQFKLPLVVGETLQADSYAVRTTKGVEASAFSNIVTLVPREAPAPPSDIELEAREAGVVVTWSADEDPEAFDLFRRLATERGYGSRLRRVPGDARRVVDRTASYGERYIYTVRTVAGTDPLVYSDPSGEREITYEDRFAPPLPENLVALPERGAVRLRWDASDAEDVAGYVLYRRNPGRDEFVPITPDPVRGEEYLDGNLASGLEFAYRVQVLDIRGNESELSAPVAATTR